MRGNSKSELQVQDISYRNIHAIMNNVALYEHATPRLKAQKKVKLRNTSKLTMRPQRAGALLAPFGCRESRLRSTPGEGEARKSYSSRE